MPKEKVLIVDDERDVLDLCKRILSTQGYQVTTVNDGYEAIEAANKERFNLLLTDIKMPGMTGLEIAQKLKEADPEIICVTMTGFATMDSAIQALSLGVDEFILKPFTPKDLSRGISKALEKEHLKKENFRLRSLIPLFELNKTLMGTIEAEKVLTRLIEIAQDATNADFAGLFVVQMQDGKMNTLFQHNHLNDTGPHQAACQQLGRAVLKDGHQKILRFDKVEQGYQDLMKQLNASSIIATPLKSQQSNLGVLVLGRIERKFAPSDSDFLSVLCGQAGIALENAWAYQQLQILDHLKSEFINIAAHELRTPLSILLGYASILEEDVNDLQKNFVSNIIRNAMRLRSLIDDMLNLKKLESGYVSISQDKIDLKKVVEQITQDLSLLSDKKHQLEIKIPDDFPEMVADRQKLELILVNLTNNAFKFTPNEGQIVFEASANGSKAEICLYNSGTFIPVAERERIFERFYQIEDSLTREHGGAGLGLSIVRGMVEVCGGNVTVESSESKGTSFNFNLPLDNSHLEAGKLRL